MEGAELSAVVDRLKGMTPAEAKAEEQRQVEVIASAIKVAIDEAHKAFEIPLLNAVGGALVTVEAGMLASLDQQHRKMLREAMNASRPTALARVLAAGGVGKPIVVTIRARGR